MTMTDEHRLGFWATINKIYHDRYRCSGMATAMVCLQGPVTAQAVRRALLQQQRRHPLLQAVITEGPRYFHLCCDRFNALSADAQLEAVPLQVCRRDPGVSREAFLEEQVARDFEADGGCLWRAVLASAPDGPDCWELILLVHHALVDGMSLARFVGDVLESCNRFIAGEQPDPAPEVLPLLPPPETLVPRQAGAGSRDAAASDEAAAAWRFERAAPLAERMPGMLLRRIDADDMTKLRQRCRAEQTTVNGALTAAYLRACVAHSSVTGRARLSSAVNLRPFCSPPVGDEHFGCFILMTQTNHAVSDEPFWDRARACQRVLQQEIAVLQRQGFAPPAFHKAFIAAAMAKNIDQGCEQRIFSGGPAISNMGVVHAAQPQVPVRLRELYFGAPQLSGLYMLFLVMCTVHGSLHCTLSFPEPLLGRPAAVRIADQFVADLQSAV